MSKTSDDRAAWLLKLALPDRQVLLARMNEREQQLLRHHWRLWAHAGQLPPPGDWQTWLILAGRGFGKTRAGAEWVREGCDRTLETCQARFGNAVNFQGEPFLPGNDQLARYASPAA